MIRGNIDFSSIKENALAMSHDYQLFISVQASTYHASRTSSNILWGNEKLRLIRLNQRQIKLLTLGNFFVEKMHLSLILRLINHV